MTTIKAIALALWLGLPGAGVATAADALEAARACMTIDDAVARVECYDAALGRASPPQGAAAAATSRTPLAGAGAAAPGTASAPAAPAAEAIDDFGLSEQARLEREGLDAAKSLEGTLAAVGRNLANRQVMTLDNGQVWVQAEATTRLRLKSGDAVTIRRAAMGSYLLIKPNHGSMRVKRLE